MDHGAESPQGVEAAAVATMERPTPSPEIHAQPESPPAPQMSPEDQAAVDRITEMFNQQQPGGTPEHMSGKINPAIREELENLPQGNKSIVASIFNLLRKFKLVK